jgi:hypothetical protein
MNLLLAFVILASSFPIGYIIKYLTKEEIKSGKIYFQATWVISLVLAIGFILFPIHDYFYKQAIIFTLLFIANVAYISWRGK